MKQIKNPEDGFDGDKTHPSLNDLLVINRLMATYTLRYINNLTEIFENDIVMSIVCLTIVSANVAHVDQYSSSEVPLKETGGAAPDDMRRPISVLGVAQSLKLPYETTRRYVRKLQSLGICEAKKGGVIIPSRVLDDARSRRAMISNANNFHRLVRDLKKLGVSLD